LPPRPRETGQGITRVDGKGEPEPVRYLIANVDGEGMLRRVPERGTGCTALIRTGMDPSECLRGLRAGDLTCG